MKNTKITLLENILNEKYIVSNDVELNPFDSNKVGFIDLDGLNIGYELDFVIDTEMLASDNSERNPVVKEIK